MARYLTKKQKTFCKYYILINDHYEAAIKAGYKESTAKYTVSKWLRDPYIKKYIKDLKKRDYSVHEYLQERLTEIAINSDSLNTLIKAVEAKEKVFNYDKPCISDSKKGSGKLTQKDLFQRIQEKADVFEKLEQSHLESDLPGNDS